MCVGGLEEVTAEGTRYLTAIVFCLFPVLNLVRLLISWRVACLSKGAGKTCAPLWASRIELRVRVDCCHKLEANEELNVAAEHAPGTSTELRETLHSVGLLRTFHCAARMEVAGSYHRAVSGWKYL